MVSTASSRQVASETARTPFCIGCSRYPPEKKPSLQCRTRGDARNYCSHDCQKADYSSRKESMSKAYQCGTQHECSSILDLWDAGSETKDDDVQWIHEPPGCGRLNHLRGYHFVRLETILLNAEMLRSILKHRSTISHVFLCGHEFWTRFLTFTYEFIPFIQLIMV